MDYTSVPSEHTDLFTHTLFSSAVRMSPSLLETVLPLPPSETVTWTSGSDVAIKTGVFLASLVVYDGGEHTLQCSP